MGTIWVFAQRAIKDLLMMLPVLDAGRVVESGTPSTTASGQPVSSEIPQQPALPSDEDDSRSAMPTAPPPSDKPARQKAPSHTDDKAKVMPDLLAPTESDGFFTLDDETEGESVELTDFWNAAVTEAGALGKRAGEVSFEEARRQGLIPMGQGTESGPDAQGKGDSQYKDSTELSDLFALDDTIVQDPAELEDFWDIAMSEGGNETQGVSGISLVEAQRQGLVTSKLTQQDDESQVGLESNEEAIDDGNPLEKKADSVSQEAEGLPSLEGVSTEESVDLDAFWNTATNENDSAGDDMTGGLSFEEAKRRGLIPNEMKTDENNE